MPKKNLILIFLICFCMLFVSCEKNPPLNPSSIESDSENVSVAIEFESFTDTETIESEENSSVDTASGDGMSISHSYYGGLLFYTGILVRWENIVGDRFQADIPDLLLRDYSEYAMVQIEVLDVVEHEVLTVDGVNFPSRIMEMDKIFLPPEALTKVEEGQVALIFIDFYNIHAASLYERELIGYMLPSWLNSRPLPIFRYENGRMWIEESQMAKSSKGTFLMRFLRDAFDANKQLYEQGVDENYHFRNGMTIDELEQFYDAVEKLPYPKNST